MLINSSQFLFVVLFLSIRKVEVETNNNHTRRDIYNVIAVLRGSVEPGGFPCAHYNVTAVLSGPVEPGGSPCIDNISAAFRGSVERGGCPCAYSNVNAVYCRTVEPGGSSCACFSPVLLM